MTPLEKANPNLIGKKFTGYAKIVEKEASIVFCRPTAEYMLDVPHYPYFPPTPKNFTVNFNLFYKD